MTAAPLRAQLPSLAVEECGDAVLPYRDCRKALRTAKKLGTAVAKLRPPPILNILMSRVIEQLRGLTDDHRQRPEPPPPPAPPTPPPTAPPADPPAPALPNGLEPIDIALALLLRHKGDITAKEVAARAGMSESKLSRHEDWKKARAIYLQSGVQSENNLDPENTGETEE